MEENNSVCEFIKYMEKKSVIENIKCAINLQFFQNMHRGWKGKFVYSEVEYEGKGITVVFKDRRQINKILYKLASHFVKRGDRGIIVE